MKQLDWSRHSDDSVPSWWTEYHAHTDSHLVKVWLSTGSGWSGAIVCKVTGVRARCDISVESLEEAKEEMSKKYEQFLEEKEVGSST